MSMQKGETSLIGLFRSRVKPIFLTLTAPIAGFTLIFFLEFFLDFELSKQVSALTNLAVVAFIAFQVFPRNLGIPFGKIETREFLRRNGFYLPENAWKHVLLGLILAGCTLSGMLVASVLTGQYVVDPSRINLPHLLFSLNPAIWEELFFRGVLIILLLKLNFPFRRALLMQLALFGIMHVKGIDLLAFVDIISVIVIAGGFTYAAYKTRSLLTGMVFHYFHDALLRFVQIPGGFGNAGLNENAMFYSALWAMVGIGCIVTNIFADKLGVQATDELYKVYN